MGTILPSMTDLEFYEKLVSSTERILSVTRRQAEQAEKRGIDSTWLRDREALLASQLEESRAELEKLRNPWTRERIIAEQPLVKVRDRFMGIETKLSVFNAGPNRAEIADASGNWIRTLTHVSWDRVIRALNDDAFLDV